MCIRDRTSTVPKLVRINEAKKLKISIRVARAIKFLFLISVGIFMTYSNVFIVEFINSH